ncbi:MAG: DUF1624 domain-containing protein [Candidatus Methanofastidiosa archaeon]|jgi:predicted acyltransferase|nr:DUF1624 domain-containing protein [Candidatus Methanofastidiosa archaeon]
MKSSKRLESIDEFRGFAILLMVIANFLARSNTVPSWLKHAPDIGFTIIDLIAPLFIFAIGLTYGLSFRKRVERDGEFKAINHFFTRYLAISGIGFFLTSMGNLTGVYPEISYWGLLQAIGAAGLITLIFIRYSTKVRIISGFIILVIYQYMLDHYWLQNVLSSSHGGIMASLSWGAMLIISTTLADFYHDIKTGKNKFIFISLGILIIGIVALFFIPISKHRVSFSFVLISIGLSALVFELFDIIIELKNIKFPVLPSWGKNPLLLYILHIFILGLFVLPQYDWWYTEASMWLLIIQLFMILGILSWIGIYLDSKKLYFSL